MRPEIVPLTHEHLVEWYGDGATRATVKGIAAHLDGKLIAIAGFGITKGVVVAFCGLADEARPYKVTMHRTALALLGEAKARHKRILAVCDANEKTSAAWLTRLGFKPDEGDIWVWQISD